MGQFVCVTFGEPLWLLFVWPFTKFGAALNRLFQLNVLSHRYLFDDMWLIVLRDLLAYQACPSNQIPGTGLVLFCNYCHKLVFREVRGGGREE